MSSIFKIIELAETDPKKAREVVKSTIARLQCMLRQLDDVIANEHTPAGVNEVVRMQVIGPDGQVKQNVNPE